MPQFFLNKRLIVLLSSIILLVALIGFSLRDREQISRPEQFLRDIVGFGQTIVAVPTNGVADFFESVKDIQNTYTENKKLKARLDELPKLSMQVKELEKENAELNDILKKENLREYTSIQATITYRDADRWYEHIIINKGKVNGVTKDMAVMTSKGLIGKIDSTSEFYSTVELLSSKNPKNKVHAVIQGNKDAFGLIEGYDEKKKMLMLKRIPYDMKVEKGEKVMTSGLGGVFPKALLIGEVEKMVPDENGLTQTAYVKPYADLYEIEHVQVVDRKVIKPKGLDSTDGEGE